MMDSTTKDAKAGQVKQLISFTVGAVEYGMELLRVKEVIRIGTITHMPRAPSFLKGVINLRGEVIPAIDLRERFGLPPQANTGMTRLIVVEIARKSVGLLVDGVSHVMRVAQADMDATPFWRDWLTRKYVFSVARVDERLIVLLDMDAILSPDEMNNLDTLDTSIQTTDSVPESETRDELHALV